ncbi:hypothetical protein MIND_01341200 [Mycena indigotica]|uniref:DUF6534 domain-containing protein n=1 Tax=Mycena indigotica TaxID=2126181 RepID=A0A8H6VW01_9AGAR|nr:uncharacterized protein MIND_01341200 [Mycena indigotica]KAF7290274.1 hypothetical protein MIND_01341200 [Mycena indigotica]
MVSSPALLLLLFPYDIGPPSSMSVPPLGIPSDIAFITGPTMLGICLNWGFMGVLAAQTYFYHVHFPDDRLLVKSLVYGLAMLDVLQTAMITADAFHWFCFGFGDMAQLNETFLNSWDVPFLDALIALVVQAFYCWRIYFIRQTILVPLGIFLISIAQCVGGIATAVKAHRLGRLSLIPTEVFEQTLWLVSGAVADVAIAVTLAWALLYKRTTTLPRTKSIISRVIRLTVETNALTAGCAVLALIIFWGAPKHPTLVVPPTAIIGKLYTNCLIAVFNNRAIEPIRSGPRVSATAPAQSRTNNHAMHSVQFAIDAEHGARAGGVSVSDGSAAEGVKVHVVREMELTYDPETELEDFPKAR